MRERAKKKISQMKKLLIQVKILPVEENQEISFSSKPPLWVQKANENVANEITKTSKGKANTKKDLLVIEEKHVGMF